MDYTQVTNDSIKDSEIARLQVINKELLAALKDLTLAYSADALHKRTFSLKAAHQAITKAEKTK